MEVQEKVNLVSISEENGIKILTHDDKKIYSVGISTGGIAEIRMVMNHSDSHVIATTIDTKGAEFAKIQVNKSGFGNRIEIKIRRYFRSIALSSRLF